ncbi:MAG: ORF6N domain-containing protein [Proteobacteria bacterium]|nr:ORF6N domain-containing protein [Desulfobacteraceae bacterium]MBU4013839.1 ORF6N domain-containing protein [Pseudomonadota bacterium]MBU4068541.1 ORF6N domain-containing protein [Pseudomonadota bacterium]MBU4101931.1 ORF6N domain-containing protein [Pseudomonadota bacterium]MBU4421173.1 ORF6N domain-containing protein [Pseudomonadota bacterium]
MSNDVSVETIAGKIYLIRGTKAMLDRDLAELYGVETKQLKRAVKRNIDRFPSDFMFDLTRDEFTNLRSHIGTSSWGGDRYLPMAFTEQGVAMLSSVLNSKRAIQVNIQIIRTFTKLRHALLDNENLRKELEELKQITDERFQIVFETLDQLINIENKPKKKIGFTAKEKRGSYGKPKKM